MRLQMVAYIIPSISYHTALPMLKGNVCTGACTHVYVTVGAIILSCMHSQAACGANIPGTYTCRTKMTTMLSRIQVVVRMVEEIYFRLLNRVGI